MASSNASVREQQSAEEKVLDSAMGVWQDMCQSDKHRAVRELLKKELQHARMVDVVQGLTAANQSLGAENERTCAENAALRATLKKTTAESVANAQQVHQLSSLGESKQKQIVALQKKLATLQGEYASLQNQYATLVEAGADDDADVKEMSIAGAMDVVPETYPQAQVVQALKLLQKAYHGLEGNMGQFAQSAQNQIRTLNEQIATLQKPGTKHALPKQPQQALRAHVNTEEDQVRTLDDALNVDYNLRNGDDVRAALKIVQEYTEPLQTEKSQSQVQIKKYKMLFDSMVSEKEELKKQKQELCSDAQYLLDMLKKYHDCVLDMDFVFKSAEAGFSGAATIEARTERVMSDKQMQTEAVPCNDDAMQTEAVPCKDDAMQTEAVPCKDKAMQTMPRPHTDNATQTEVTPEDTETLWAILALKAVVRQWQRAQGRVHMLEVANEEFEVAYNDQQRKLDWEIKHKHDIEAENRAMYIQVEEAMQQKCAAGEQAQNCYQMAIDVMQKTVFREQTSASHFDDMARRAQLEAVDASNRCLHLQACMNALQMQLVDMQRAQEGQEDDLQSEEEEGDARP